MDIYRVAAVALTALALCANASRADDYGKTPVSVAIKPPCGDVFFNPVSQGRPNPDGSISERMAVTVTFPDSHKEKVLLPYPWTFSNPEQTDPWSATNVRLHPDEAVVMVLPPAGTDTSSYAPLVKYVLAHTNAGGFSTMIPCPLAASPTPAPTTMP
jgi:hypothetical protein